MIRFLKQIILMIRFCVIILDLKIKMCYYISTKDKNVSLLC